MEANLRITINFFFPPTRVINGVWEVRILVINRFKLVNLVAETSLNLGLRTPLLTPSARFFVMIQYGHIMERTRIREHEQNRGWVGNKL